MRGLQAMSPGLTSKLQQSKPASPHGVSHQWAASVPKPHQRLNRNSFWSSWAVDTANPTGPENHIVSNEQLEVMYMVRKQPAASGAFGHVYSGKCRQNGADVAIKAMKKQMNPNGLREIEMLARVDHPAVAKCLGCFEDDEHVYLVTPFYTGGDLFDHIIENEGEIQELQAMHVCVNLLESVRATHQAGLAHLDVKPENFVFTDLSRSQLVLVDFGSAELFVQNPFAKDTCDYLAGYDDRMQDIKRLTGTAEYMPPEVARETRFSSRSDVWGVGVVLYVMLTGRVPYSTTKTGTPQEHPKFEQVAECIESVDQISSTGRQIMKDMMNLSARRRPSPSEALSVIMEHIRVLNNRECI